MSKRRKRGPLTGEISDLVQFAAEIRAGRAVLGWSQTELAKRTAVTQRAIYCIEQNIVQYRGSKPKRRIIEAFTDAGFGSSAAGRFQDDGAEHNSEADFRYLVGQGSRSSVARTTAGMRVLLRKPIRTG
jgi:transcriptional regulator with XRE-family HTH domain